MLKPTNVYHTIPYDKPYTLITVLYSYTIVYYYIIGPPRRAGRAGGLRGVAAGRRAPAVDAGGQSYYQLVCLLLV